MRLYTLVILIVHEHVAVTGRQSQKSFSISPSSFLSFLRVNERELLLLTATCTIKLLSFLLLACERQLKVSLMRLLSEEKKKKSKMTVDILLEERIYCYWKLLKCFHGKEKIIQNNFEIYRNFIMIFSYHLGGLNKSN